MDDAVRPPIGMPWTELAASLSRSTLQADDSAARRRWHCSGDEAALERISTSSRQLRTVLANTPVDEVLSVVVPASGADVLSAQAAFPRAVAYTLISRESALSDPRSIHALTNNSTAAGQLKAVFSCSHSGAFLLGIQLRAFAAQWGILPPLLFALSLGRVRIMDVIQHTASSLPGVTIVGCRPESFPRSVSKGSGCQRIRVRYVQAALHDPSAIERVVAMLQHSEQKRSVARRRALLVRGTEVAFRGGDPSARVRKAQDLLSDGLLRHTDVLLQEADASLRWSVLRAWVERHQAQLLPLGAYIGPDEALYPPPGDARAAEHTAENREELEYMRHLWTNSSRWRSLRGTRFGYCHQQRDLSEAILAARRPLAEVPASERENGGQPGRGPLYCAALLAWRSY